jgi:hypothetical protein
MTFCNLINYRKVVQDFEGRFRADSNSEKSDPKIPSGQPNHASECLSVSRSRIVQDYIRPNVMATSLDALQSSRRFQLSFTDTEWEDSLHPSGH